MNIWEKNKCYLWWKTPHFWENVFFFKLKVPLLQRELLIKTILYFNSPVSQYERPRAVALASSTCVDKTTKIITEFPRKRSFLRLKRVNLVLQKVSLWSKSICVTCKLLMSVYLDIKLLYPRLKVNWNVLLCKICIARRLVVYIFPWCNAHYVPFPSGTLVAGRMGNGSIVLTLSFFSSLGFSGALRSALYMLKAKSLCSISLNNSANNDT